MRGLSGSGLHGEKWNRHQPLFPEPQGKVSGKTSFCNGAEKGAASSWSGPVIVHESEFLYRHYNCDLIIGTPRFDYPDPGKMDQCSIPHLRTDTSLRTGITDQQLHVTPTLPRARS